VSDVFSSLVGQDRAVALMRELVKSPVHAYLFTGSPGSGMIDAVPLFCAALQCPDHGCGVCEGCQSALRGTDTDVNQLTRAGASWSVDEIHNAERVARRRPLGAGHQIVILENIELAVSGSNTVPALLKTLEEPPTKTIFILTAEELPEELETVVSRCVEVPFQGLAHEDVVRILMNEGVTASNADVAAHAASGNLRRARVLATDPAIAERMSLWRELPSRLDGRVSTSTGLVAEIVQALNVAIAPLVAMQEAELDQLITQARDLGYRSVANRKEIEQQHKREQRRFRADDIRFGLSTLASVYRERLHESVNNLDDARLHYRAGACMRAIAVISEANARLGSNMDENLLLTDLLCGLMDL